MVATWLVNAQGVTDLGDTTAEGLEPDVFERVMGLNVASVLRVARAAAARA